MTPAEHRARALALAEAATDPRDVAVYRTVAAAWARISAPPIPWSHAPAQRALAQLQTDCRQPLPAQQSAVPETAAPCQIERKERVPVATITF